MANNSKCSVFDITCTLNSWKELYMFDIVLCSFYQVQPGTFGFSGAGIRLIFYKSMTQNYKTFSTKSTLRFLYFVLLASYIRSVAAEKSLSDSNRLKLCWALWDVGASCQTGKLTKPLSFFTLVRMLREEWQFRDSILTLTSCHVVLLWLALLIFPASYHHIFISAYTLQFTSIKKNIGKYELYVCNLMHTPLHQ